jgi:hypothetical protein
VHTDCSPHLALRHSCHFLLRWPSPSSVHDRKEIPPWISYAPASTPSNTTSTPCTSRPVPWNAGGAGGAGLACGLVALGLLNWALPVGTAQEESPAGGNRSLEQRLAALEHKLRHLTSATDEDGRIEVVITGAKPAPCEWPGTDGLRARG